MKKIMCFLLALSLLMLGLAGAAADSAVYTGSARGMQGEVVVNVTIEDGKMTKSLSLISDCKDPVILDSEGFIKAIKETLETLL